MTDALHLKKQGLIIDGCLAKVERYCQHYAFPDYDLVGRQYAMESSTLRNELLDAMNSAMRARSSRVAWEPFLGKSLNELELLPPDVDLIHSSDEEYVTYRAALRACYERLVERAGITDMAATKMLHLKRPKFIAISDSYVRQALGVQGLAGAERGLAVADSIREIGKQNLQMLNELQDQIQQISPLYAISKVRLIDIIVWSYMTQNGTKEQQPKTITWTKSGSNMKQVHTGAVDEQTYHISLCQQRDRYIVAIDGNFVMHDEELPVDDGKGAINVRCPGNRRGWYYLKHAKAFCESHIQQS